MPQNGSKIPRVLAPPSWFYNLYCTASVLTESWPKDAVKALKKKLSKNCNHKEIRLTLSLLDMCIENCGPRFQSLVVKKDFCKDKLVKLLNPRYNLPIDMQEKILTFIMTWARGFQGTVDVSEVKEVYLELLKKGVEFPSSDTNREGTKTSSQPSTKSSPSSANPAKRSLLPLPTGPTLLLTPEQIGKLYSELDMAKMNVRVMSSILKENVPGSENPDDMNLLQKLYKTCRMMQERIMELLVTVENEDVIVELIQVNEDLNNVLLGHERFSRNRVRFLENQRIQRERTELYRKQPSAPSSDLLDLSVDSPSPVPAVVQTDSAVSPSGLNCISAHPEDKTRHHSSIYPQLDLTTTTKAQQFPFATEAQNNSVSNPAGHSYSNVSNTHVQDNHSLLATVKMRMVWIYPNCCPNGIQRCVLWPFPMHQGTLCIWGPGQLSSLILQMLIGKHIFLGSSTVLGNFAENSCSIICLICCCVKQAEISC
ncbi:TOM1-like protein 1 isoform X1 [Athene cunicularia]|uniref:TOM1-like protein 1 isoform X1 n=1 Tax=Athene cunicularia TaxID=194338 RepID=UPI000EF6BE56|nr:TOM1-like protein 1 isoform X1 [Athene cunicularia]